MSKNGIPKGYTNQSVTQLQAQSRQLLYDLGCAYYNEESAIREQSRLQDMLQELESLLAYATRQEQAETVAKKNAEVRAENAAPKAEVTPSDASQVSNP